MRYGLFRVFRACGAGGRKNLKNYLIRVIRAQNAVVYHCKKEMTPTEENVSIDLDYLQRDTALRLSAFEGMLHHLDLDPGADQAPVLLPELINALKSCGACPTPGRCAGWCAAGYAGTPEFCSATQAFRNLMLAGEALKIRAA